MCVIIPEYYYITLASDIVRKKSDPCSSLFLWIIQISCLYMQSILHPKPLLMFIVSVTVPF